MTLVYVLAMTDHTLRNTTRITLNRMPANRNPHPAVIAVTHPIDTAISRRVTLQVTLRLFTRAGHVIRMQRRIPTIDRRRQQARRKAKHLVQRLVSLDPTTRNVPCQQARTRNRRRNVQPVPVLGLLAHVRNNNRNAVAFRIAKLRSQRPPRAVPRSHSLVIRAMCAPWARRSRTRDRISSKPL